MKNRLSGSKFLNALIIVVILTLPLMYAGLFTWAYEKPMDNLGEIDAVVINEDKPADATLASGKTLHLDLGKDLSKELFADDAPGFHWIPAKSAEDAKKGLADGTYQVALWIPADLSHNLAQLSELKTPEKTTLKLETNDGINYLTGTMARSVALTLQNLVSEKGAGKFADNLLLSLSDIHDGMGQAADGAGKLTDGNMKLADGANTLAEGTDKLAAGSNTLSEGANRLSNGAKELNAGTKTLANGTDELQKNVGKLSAGADALKHGASQANNGAQALSVGAHRLTASISEFATGSARLNQALAAYTGGVSQVNAGAKKLNAGIGRFSENFDTLKNGLGDLDSALQQTGPGSLKGGMASLIAATSPGTDPDHHPTLADGANQIATGAEALNSGSQQLAAGAGKLDAGLGQMNQGISQLGAASKQAQGKLDKIAGGINQLRSQMTKGPDPVKNPNLYDGVVKLNAELDPNTANTLGSGADQLADMVNKLILGCKIFPGDKICMMWKGELSAKGLDFKALKVKTGELKAGIKAAHNGTQNMKDGLDKAYEKSELLADTFTKKGTADNPTFYDFVNGVCWATNPSNSVDPKKATLADAGKALKEGAESLYTGSQQLAVGAGELKAGADREAAGIKQANEGLMALAIGADKVAAGVNKASQGSNALGGGLTQLSNGATELSAGANKLDQNTPALIAGMGKLNDGAGLLRAGSNQLSNGADKLAGGTSSLYAGADTLHQGVGKFNQGVNKLNSGAKRLNTGAGSLDQGLNRLNSGAKDLNNGIERLDSGAKELSNGANTAEDGAKTLKTKLTEGSEKVPNLSEDKSKKLSDVAASPIHVDAVRANAVAENGVGFAPFFMCLAMWVGGIAIFLMLPALDRRRHPGERFYISALRSLRLTTPFALAQSIFVVVGLEVLLGLGAKDLLLLFGVCMVTSFSFVVLNQGFIALLGFRGRFVSVLMLLLQITSAGATFPVETMPKFFQVLHPLLPMTYCAAAIREYIAGANLPVFNGFWIVMLWTAIGFGMTLLGAWLNPGEKPLKHDPAFAFPNHAHAAATS